MNAIEKAERATFPLVNRHANRNSTEPDPLGDRTRPRTGLPGAGKPPQNSDGPDTGGIDVRSPRFSHNK
ncbi:hypothetical protein [Streptomyces sp. C184]|uniref:hypothetical protein n=1 Tax=Streptomyces sp. C184 TaxID=3237121 RepID=UPI0034C629C0